MIHAKFKIKRFLLSYIFSNSFVFFSIRLIYLSTKCYQLLDSNFRKLSFSEISSSPYKLCFM